MLKLGRQSYRNPPRRAMDADLPPAAERILQALADAQQITRAPVPTVLVADVVGWPPRTVRYYLAQAERAGRVERPRGVKSGWWAG